MIFKNAIWNSKIILFKKKNNFQITFHNIVKLWCLYNKITCKIMYFTLCIFLNQFDRVIKLFIRSRLTKVVKSRFTILFKLWCLYNKITCKMNQDINKQNNHILDVFIIWSCNIFIVKDIKIFYTYRRYVVVHETSWCSHENANDFENFFFKESQKTSH
jgi:hypothetical protein